MMLWLNKTMASNPLADRSKGLWLYNKRVGSWAGRRGNKQSAAEKASCSRSGQSECLDRKVVGQDGEAKARDDEEATKKAFALARRWR